MGEAPSKLRGQAGSEQITVPTSLHYNRCLSCEKGKSVLGILLLQLLTAESTIDPSSKPDSAVCNADCANKRERANNSFSGAVVHYVLS